MKLQRLELHIPARDSTRDKTAKYRYAAPDTLRRMTKRRAFIIKHTRNPRTMYLVDCQETEVTYFNESFHKLVSKIKHGSNWRRICIQKHAL
jgi:hypothetical protein